MTSRTTAHPHALRSAALGGAATLAGAGAVAWYGRSLDAPLDARVRHWLRARHHPVVHGASQGVALLGSIPVVIAGAALGAAIVGRRCSPSATRPTARSPSRPSRAGTRRA